VKDVSFLCLLLILLAMGVWLGAKSWPQGGWSERWLALWCVAGMMMSVGMRERLWVIHIIGAFIGILRGKVHLYSCARAEKNS